MYVYIYMNGHAEVCAHAYAFVYVQQCVGGAVHVYTCVLVYADVCAQQCVLKGVLKSANIRAYIFACMCADICVYVY